MLLKTHFARTILAVIAASILASAQVVACFVVVADAVDPQQINTNS